MESSANIGAASPAAVASAGAGARAGVLLSTRRLLAFVVLASLFTMSAGQITDPDFWWHLRTGQLIYETRAVPSVDPFSFTAHGREWVAHEWLTELLMYAVYRLAGWGGLIVSFAACMTGALMIVYGRAARAASHPFAAATATLLAAYASAPMWGVRPQMISFLLASVFVALLDSYGRDGRARRLLWLPPLMLVWVNMHGGFALGLALVGLTAAGVVLDEAIGRGRDGKSEASDLSTSDLSSSDSSSSVMPSSATPSARAWARRVWPRAWRRARPLLYALAACAAVVPLNPSGARLFTYPIETLRSGAMQRHIHEWFSPDFHRPEAHAFALLLFAALVALALSPKRARPRELLLFCVTAYAGLRSWRNIPVFALVAAPLLAEHAWHLIAARNRRRNSSAATEGRGAGSNGVVLKSILNAALFVVIPAGLCVAAVSRAAARQEAVEAEKFPAAAVEFLRAREAGPIFNAYGWGGYLIWKLHPARLVYIDGRADVYGDEFVEDFLKTEGGEPGWRARLERDSVRAVLIVPEAALASLLREDALWEKVYEDSQAVIFFKR